MPAATPWYVGVQVPLTFTLTDSNGTAQNASGGTGTVVATVTLPDGTTSLPAVSAPGGTGVYAAVYTTTQVGHHIVTWAVPGTTPGSYTDTFEVQPALDTTLVSLAEAKEILKLTATAQYDPVVQGYNSAITAWIESVVGPCVQRTVVEVLPADGLAQALSQPPVISLTPWVSTPFFLANSGIPIPSPASPMYPMRIYGITYPAAALSLDPYRGIVKHQSGLPFIFGDYAWQYLAGRAVVPSSAYEAAKIALKHLYGVERGGQPGGTQAGYGSSEAEGVQTGFGFAVPNRAIQLLTATPGSGAYRAAVA
jgi:hypothetical protein